MGERGWQPDSRIPPAFPPKALEELLSVQAVIEVRARAPSPWQELAHMVPLVGLTVPGTGPRQRLCSLVTPGSSGNASLVLAQGMALQ